MFEAKIISSLDKCFLDSRINDFAELKGLCVFRNQRISLQIALTDAHPNTPHRRFVKLGCTGIPEQCVTFRMVDLVPSYLPVYPGSYDSGYVRTAPGLYPDLLSPMQMGGCMPLCSLQLRTAWVDIDMNALSAQEYAAGEHLLTITLSWGEEKLELPFTLTVIPAELPDTDFHVTQWFHCDSLANYYDCEVFSERHWEIVEKFVRTFVRCGNNTLLTPVFTPPLDTYVGGERRTAQLVGVTLTKTGEYLFDFTKLDRWLDMADRCGVRYFEISHLFTQWGAAHAPKAMADTPDGYRRIFGWETDATGEEYPVFLRRFLTEFLDHMKKRGDDKRCIFHISDEPNSQQLEQYLKSKAVVADLLEGYTMIDALSNVDFYLSGAVSTPVPCNNHIEPFIEAFREKGATGLWTYYCCGQNVDVSNRLLAMYGARTRYIGVQFWKYDIAGFLQWGFNFYNNQGSYDPLNPYVDTTGNYFVPSGDCFSVYPASDGSALESMRINHFREGLDDRRALLLCESLIGREATLAAVEEITGEVVFSRCVCDSVTMTRLRDRIDRLILANLK